MYLNKHRTVEDLLTDILGRELLQVVVEVKAYALNISVLKLCDLYQNASGKHLLVDFRCVSANVALHLSAIEPQVFSSISCLLKFPGIWNINDSNGSGRRVPCFCCLTSIYLCTFPPRITYAVLMPSLDVFATFLFLFCF